MNRLIKELHEGEYISIDISYRFFKHRLQCTLNTFKILKENHLIEYLHESTP